MSTVQTLSSVLEAVNHPAVLALPSDDKISPGFMGFMVMFGLAVATLLLMLNMVKHLRKVRYGSEEPPVGEAREGKGGAGSAGGAGGSGAAGSAGGSAAE